MRWFISLVLFLPMACHGAQAFSATTNTLTVTPGVSIPLTGSISVAVFPTYSQNDSQYHIMFESYSGAGSNFQLIKGNANTMYLSIDNGSGSVFAITAPLNSFSLPTSAWSVVTAEWTNGGSMFLYLNGITIASSASSGTPNLSWTGTGAQPWSVGNRQTGGFDSRGEVALAGLWNRLLTQQEINGLILRFSAKAVAPSGLISSWDLAGASLVDSQSGYNLTSSGTTTATDPSHINLGTTGNPQYGAIY